MRATARYVHHAPGSGAHASHLAPALLEIDRELTALDAVNLLWLVPVHHGRASAGGQRDLGGEQRPAALLARDSKGDLVAADPQPVTRVGEARLLARHPLPATTARRAPENLAILLREPFRAMTEELMQQLAERGHPEVRFPHGNVFQYLDDDGTRIGVLAERAGVSKQAMGQLVVHLEQHGYVERLPDPADRRAQLVRATTRGQAVFAIAREMMAEIDTRLERRLGKAKARQLRALLEELNEALPPTPAQPER